MSRADLRQRAILGRTGLRISRIGLAGGYKVPSAAVERAFHEHGINYFYWETRKPGMKEALRDLVPAHREDMVIAVQTYDHFGLWMRRSVEKALRELTIDRADILFLGWFNKPPGGRVRDMALRLKDEGKVRFLGVSGHNRKAHGAMARSADSPFDVHMVRYNAAHRGAEAEVFDGLPDIRPGITTYVATRWGKLLQKRNMPPGERPMTAAECYRFVLSHSSVDLCLSGPRTLEQMEEGLSALAQGSLSPEEMERIRAIGDHVHG